MSRLRSRFTVELTVGRTLATDIDADSPEIALALAEHLFNLYGADAFRGGPETLIDVDIVDGPEVV